MRDLLVVGAGPAGLAAAIAAVRSGLDHEVVEKGVLVDAIFRFPHGMSFFTTPELLELGALPFVSPFPKPTREEALAYYRRVVDTFRIRVSLGERVEADRAAGQRVPGAHDAGVPGRRPSRPRGARATSSWRPATTTTRSGSACPARTCPTCRTTSTSRTRTTAGAW